MAKTASSAMAATIHGSRPVLPAGAAPAETVAPQWWQNFAPGVSSPPHAAHFPPASEAPQLAQKRPLPGVSQEGQTGDSEDISIGLQKKVRPTATEYYQNRSW
jgi:hypothetical protein